MRGLRRSAILLTTLVAALAVGQDVPVEKYRLPNGMTVILHEDHTVPVATINIWYRVGSKDEPARRSGFAHLFEHLMFMGTKRVPNGQFDQIMETGGGNNNASTAEDRTNYYSIGPSNLLPTLLWLDADRLEALGDNTTKEKLDLQRDVVKNERRQNVENSPYGKAYEAINSIMFPADHPYGHSVIGSMQDLSDAELQDVKDFFATFYVPNNASLVVAGDFDSKKIKPLIDQWFGSLPRKDDPPRPYVPAAKLDGVVRRTVIDQVQASKVIMTWHSPAAYRPGDAEMKIAAAVLTNGLGSRLYERLVVREKVATEVSAFQESRSLGSLFYVDATVAPGVDPAKVEALIDQELETLKQGGPRPDEMKRIVAQIEYGSLAQLQSIQQKADKLNEYEFYFGEPNSFARELDLYRKATPKAVGDAVRRTLDRDVRLIMRVVPQSEVDAQGSNPRDGQPDIPKEAAFNPPAPKIFALSNGIKVQYFNRPELPLMAVTALFRGGAENDPDDKLGRGRMTAAMLDEGAGTRNARQFQDALDNIGASFRAGADETSTTASLSVLATKFDQGLALYADALMRPRFDAEAFERVQRLSVVNLEQENDDPNTVAQREAFREYFGPNHPFGTPASGTPETVRKLGPDDLRAQYQGIFRPENATLFVAGSLDEATVRAQLEKQFGGWRAAGNLLTKPKYEMPEGKGLRAVVIHRPGAVQTVVRFVMPAPTYESPDREGLRNLGTILGGSFTSRLNQNLREDKGYTYGAGGGFILYPEVGYLVASSAVRADVTGASIKEFFTEFDRLGKGDVTEGEAGKAASTRRADIVSSMGSLSGLLSLAVTYAQNGRPFSAVGDDLQALGRLQAMELNELARRSIPVDQALLILVGDKDAILEQLKAVRPDLKVEVKE
jgi:predicted Zn-dependent peptidase